MKKLLLVVAIIVALVALVWFAGSHYLNSRALTATSERWPNNLGTTDDIAKHFPPHGNNETANAIAELSKPLGIEPIRGALAEHLSRAISKDGDVVDAPPPAVAEWLTKHATEVRVLQQQLVTHESPQWAVDANALIEPPMPRLIAQMEFFRVLSLDALEQHRAANDAVAWNDLHAAWKLAQGLLARPELISQLIGIAGARMSNGVAAKLSAPEPAWRHELASFDFGAAAVAAYAYESAHSWRYVTHYPAGEPDENRTRNHVRHVTGILLVPWIRYQAGLALEAQRKIATELASLRACDPHPRMPRGMPNIGEAWRRIGRFRAEIEGVEKLLALKAARAQSGSWPQSMPSIEGSSCSDGRWRYRREADGSMSLAFSKPIAVASSQAAVVPLTFRRADL